MRRLQIPGGSFCDCLPTGEYAVVWERDLVTHVGTVIAPTPLLFPRITNAPVFKIAAKTHSPGDIVIWDGREWRQDPRISHGVQGHIWQPDGALFVIEPGEHIESQGIRYWNTGPVYGSPTYSPSTDLAKNLGVKRLYGWSYFDGIAIGQGDQGGCVIQHQGQHYLLEPGHLEFIQVHKSGNTISVAMYETKAGYAVLCWLDVSEIPTLPAYGPTQPAPAPQPPPTPKPEPQPVSTIRPDAAFVGFANRRWSELRVDEQISSLPADATREQLAAPASNALFRIVGDWHHAFGGIAYGLYPKTSGTNHRGFGEDIILIKRDGQVYWKDAGVAFGSRNPSLAVDGEYQRSEEPEKWAAPPVPNSGTTAPNPGTPPDSSSSLSEKLDKLRTELDKVQLDLRMFGAEFAALKIRLADLEQRPAPQLKTTTSGRWFGPHSHDVVEK